MLKVLSNALLHLVAGAAGLFIIFSLTAQGAAAASCTSSGPVGPKTVTATLDGAISSTVGSGASDGCTLIAQGNLDQSGSITEFGYTWTLIQKDVFANDGSAGALVITDTSGDPNDSKTGTWSIDTSQTGAYNAFIVGLKPDGGFVYYNVGANTSGTYGVPGDPDDLSHGMSHANLYGRVVPLPAAAWLFGSALLGLVVTARRRAAAT